LPVSDVAAVGGWKDIATLLRCYQQPDRETLRAVMAEPRKLRDVGLQLECTAAAEGHTTTEKQTTKQTTNRQWAKKASRPDRTKVPPSLVVAPPGLEPGLF
jgi:hypothetical protein